MASLQLSGLWEGSACLALLLVPPWEPAEQGLGIKPVNKADVASVFLTALPAR